VDLILVALLVLAAAAAAYLVYSRSAGGSARRAFTAPLATVAETTAPAVARLSGTVVAIGDAPVSEASGRSYVVRDLRIVEGGGGDSSSTRPAQQAVDFLLDDGTGIALVRSADAAVSIERDHELPRTTLDQLPWVDAILRAGGYRNGSPETCTIRLYEGVLAPGDRAGVAVHVEPADDAARAVGAAVVVRAAGPARVAIRREAEPTAP
jgi:hypothetical protein